MASTTARFLANAIRGVFGGAGVPPATGPGSLRRPPLRRKPVFDALEQRLLLSADPVGALSGDPVETAEPVVSAPLAEENAAGATAPVIIAQLPLAENDEYVLQEDGALKVDAPGVLSNDSAEGPLEAVLDSGPMHGVLVLNANGSFDYTPEADYFGFDQFTYRAQIAEGVASDIATVLLSIDPSNDAPIADDDSFGTPENVALTISIEALLQNDHDVDGDTLAWNGLVDQPLNGVLEETYNSWGGLDGFVYRPNDNFTGQDSFSYTVRDRDGSDALVSSPAQVIITVGGGNVAPVAEPDEFTTGEDTVLTVAAEDGLLANDSGKDGAVLVAVLVDGPAHGSVELDGKGGFVYTPAADFFGQDAFTYRASDGTLESDIAEVTIEVMAANDAPAFVSDPVTTFTIDGDACGFEGDGVFRVAGAPGEAVQVELNWTFREALYNNEVGIYRVSDQDGRVDNLLPGDADYAKVALAAGNAQVVFVSGAGAGAHAELELEGGATYAFYVIQNGKTSTFLASNPDNKLDGGPLAFFSIAAANPDGFDHVHAAIEAQSGLLKLRWEDLTKGGDADYNDVVMTAAGLAASSDDVVYVYAAQAEDVDGDQLTYRLAEAPEGAFIDPHTGVLSWAATAGVFHFVVEAVDGEGAVAEQAFDLTVAARSTDLVVRGTDGDDRIEVSEHDGLVTVRVNDVARTYCHVSSVRVEALGGNDDVWLSGLTMGTTVDGGDGNDCIDAGAVLSRGVVLYGGAGNDHLTGGAGDDRIDGGTGDDELHGGRGNDLLVGGQGADWLYGGDGNDLLDGGAGDDQLRGGGGNDLLFADSGNDSLKGEEGNDILVGGTGNDMTQGNYGADLLVDGPGCDTSDTRAWQGDQWVDGSTYGIPDTLPAGAGPIIDWSSRYEPLVSALQQFADHPSNPQWWADFVNNLGQSDAEVNPNSQIRVVGPGTGA